MSEPLPVPPGFDDLPIEERLDYVESLWDRIVAHPDEVPVPDWHRRIVRERLAAHHADPGAVIPWEEVRDELFDKLKRRSQR